VADAANTFSNSYHSTGHTITAGTTFNLGPVQLLPSAAMTWSREHQDYTRAMLDTTAVRNRFKVEPTFKASWKVNSGMNIELNYSYKTTRPELLQTIGYRDMSDPLFITEGNPGLKDSHTNEIQMSYKAVVPSRQLSIGFNAKCSTSDHSNITALSYDPVTNVYTSRPESVPGSRTWEVNLNYDHGLGNYFRLQNDLKVTGGKYYGFLTMLPTHDERILNRQTSVHPKDKLAVSFDHIGSRPLSLLNLTPTGYVSRSRQSRTPPCGTTTTAWSLRPTTATLCSPQDSPSICGAAMPPVG
jgi:hypothetical protein